MEVGSEQEAVAEAVHHVFPLIVGILLVHVQRVCFAFVRAAFPARAGALDTGSRPS